MVYHSLELYGYGLLLVLLVSGCSLLGVFLIPCVTRNARCGRMYVYANTLMVSSAVSALFCDAILLLIPEVFGLEQGRVTTNVTLDASPTRVERNKTPFLWKACVVIAGIYTFYLLESLLRQCTGDKDLHDQAHLKPGPDPSLVVTSDSELEYDESISEKMSYLTTDSVGDKAIWHSNGYLEKKPLVSGHSSKVHKFAPKLTAMNTCSRILTSAPCMFLKTIKPLAWLIIIGDGLHNFTDGLALGVSITQGLSLGISTAVAMIIHEIPHELGDFAILLSTGMKWPAAIALNFIHSLTAVGGFFIGVTLGTDVQQSTEWILGATAGVFLYIALVDLLPHLTRPTKGISELSFFVLTNVGMVTTFVALLLIAIYEEELNSLVLDP